MIKILFVCHGNICRSPMAEYVLKKMVRERGVSDDFEIASAATSREELGSPVYPPAKRKLAEHGIGCKGHRARLMSRDDYDYYDLIICMDHRNIRYLRPIIGEDTDQKVSFLLDYTDRAGEEVADPWFTGNFDATWRDIVEGCAGLLKELTE